MVSRGNPARSHKRDIKTAGAVRLERHRGRFKFFQTNIASRRIAPVTTQKTAASASSAANVRPKPWLPKVAKAMRRANRNRIRTAPGRTGAEEGLPVGTAARLNSNFPTIESERLLTIRFRREKPDRRVGAFGRM